MTPSNEPHDDQTPDENTPLLAQSVTAAPLAPGTAVPAPTVSTADVIGEDGVDGGVLERAVSNADRLKQFEGLPEVRARMSWILPAIGVGVSVLNSFTILQHLDYEYS